MTIQNSILYNILINRASAPRNPSITKRNPNSYCISKLVPRGGVHNLPTFVLFADLVKAFYTSNHKLMVEILKKYGCPPQIMLSNKEDVHGQQSEAHTRKYLHINTFRNWIKTRRQRCTCPLPTHHDGICRNTRKGMGDKWITND